MLLNLYRGSHSFVRTYPFVIVLCKTVLFYLVYADSTYNVLKIVEMD
jgi:hypothetical protein